MNLFKKIYCRIYQTAFRIAMPLLPYREPEVLEHVSDVPELLQKSAVRSVLLVTGKHLYGRGATADLEKRLADAGILCTVYSETSPNPTVFNVEAARQLYEEGKCEALIAFGGGSPIDCAKAVGARIAYPKRSVNQLKGLLRIRKKIPALIAIPTTAGSGSEVTITAVITDSEKKHKYTMNSFPLIPAYAVLDPAVTYTLPPSLTATTGMDAMTHAVEAYIGNSTTGLTRKYAKEAVKLIFENLETAYKDGTNEVARRNMLRASNIAGIAFSRSYVGYIHAVAHSLGGQYNVPHGLANAILMPIVLEEYGESVYQKLHELAVVAGLSKESDNVAESAKRFIQAIREMNARMGIPTGFTEIQKEDIPALAKYADAEGNPLYPVPKLMDAKELEKIYHKAML